MPQFRTLFDLFSASFLFLALLVFPAQLFADGMEESPPGVQLENAKGKVFSGKKEKAPVRQVGKTGNTKAINDFELAKYQYCGSDSDCVVAVNGCCDCANGGIEVAVNKDRVENFRSRFDCLHVACTRRAASPPCENGVVSCISHRCQYFDDRPTAANTAPAPRSSAAGSDETRNPAAASDENEEQDDEE